jgi:hypothetical protein
LTLSDEQIGDLLENYDRQSRAIKDDAIRLVWWMRGGISYEDAMTLSLDEKTMINDLIKENMETTKKSGMPFF